MPADIDGPLSPCVHTPPPVHSATHLKFKRADIHLVHLGAMGVYGYGTAGVKSRKVILI